MSSERLTLSLRLPIFIWNGFGKLGCRKDQIGKSIETFLGSEYTLDENSVCTQKEDETESSV